MSDKDITTSEDLLSTYSGLSRPLTQRRLRWGWQRAFRRGETFMPSLHGCQPNAVSNRCLFWSALHIAPSWFSIEIGVKEEHGKTSFAKTQTKHSNRSAVSVRSQKEFRPTRVVSPDKDRQSTAWNTLQATNRNAPMPGNKTKKIVLLSLT